MSGIDFVASVPCINLRELLSLVGQEPRIHHVPVTREEEGVGICAGAYMGGKKPALLIQNSGLGNSINALASLTLLYHIPILIILSHRGVEGEWIEAQKPMGALTEPLLDIMGIPQVCPSSEGIEDLVAEEARLAFEEKHPRAILLNIHFWRSP